MIGRDLYISESFSSPRLIPGFIFYRGIFTAQNPKSKTPRAWFMRK